MVTRADPGEFPPASVVALDQARKSWESVVAGGKSGSVVFIVDEGETGATLFLRRVALELKPEKPKLLVAGDFVAGRYTPWDMPGAGGMPIAEMLGFAQSASGWIHPLVSQVIGLSRSAHALLGKLTNGRAAAVPGDAVAALLAAAAEDAPVLLALAQADRASEAERGFFHSLLLTLAQRINTELPIALLVGIGAGSRDAAEPSWIGEQLERRQLAERWHLPRLNVGDVGVWLGQGSRELVEALIETGGGSDAATLEAWREWRARGWIVQHGAKEWRLKEGIKHDEIGLRSVVDRRLPQLLAGAPLANVESARQVLACGALEGSSFTATAVAAALQRDPDAVIDMLDDHLTREPERPHGLVVDIGFASLSRPDDEPRNLACYAFATDFVRRAFEVSLTDDERVSQSKALGNTLAAAYEGTRTKARTISHLLAYGGDHERASRFAAIASYEHDRVEATMSLRLLVAREPRDDAERRFFRDRLVEELHKASQAGPWYLPPGDSLSAADRVYELSSDPVHGSRTRACIGRLVAAHSLVEMGNFKKALDRAESAAALADGLSGQGELVSEVHLLLSAIQKLLGEHDAARASTKRSLAAKETPYGYLDLGWMEGHSEAGRRAVERALELSRQRGNPLELLNVLPAVAEFESKGDEPNGRARAEELLDEAITIAANERQRFIEGRLRVMIARLRRAAGDHESAQTAFELAFAAGEEIGDTILSTTALAGLALCELEVGRIDASLGHFTEARSAQSTLRPPPPRQREMVELLEDLAAYERLYADASRSGTRMSGDGSEADAET